MSEQEAEKVFSELSQKINTLNLVENIMGVNEREENNDMVADKDLQDIKEQLAEVKTEIAQLKSHILYDKMTFLLYSHKYSEFMSLVRGVTKDPISLGQYLFDNLVIIIGHIIKLLEEEKKPNQLDGVKSQMKKYADANNLNAEKLEQLR